MGTARYGLWIYDYPPEEIVPLATRAEALGFETLWMGEHYISPKQFSSAHPGLDEHPLARIVGPQIRMQDPLVALSAAAGATTRLKLGTGICIAPLNHPLILARAALTAQTISGGRLLLGTGVGWLEEEYEALGVPFGTRASRYDELLDIMQRAWAGGYFEHQGEHFSFSPVQLTPNPVHVPLVLGGNSDRALRRVAQRAHAWINSALIGVDEAARLRDRLEDFRREAGTAGQPFTYYVRPKSAAPEEVDKFVAEGFEDIVLLGIQLWPASADRTVTEKISQFTSMSRALGLDG